MSSNISVPGGSKPRIVLFPFMSKGHMIPLLQLARLFVNRGLSVTIFTTPANHPFVADSLTRVEHVSIIDLPFPENMPAEIPEGVESTEKLPSMSLFIPFVNGIKLMQPHFEEALQSIHSKVSCIISDEFLHWTLQSASRLGIPRVSFIGMNYYATTVFLALKQAGLIHLHESPDEPFAVPDFPWIRLTRNHFDEPFDKRDPRGPHLDFLMESVTATMNSHGKLVNSFYELEETFADYYNRECKPKAWPVGPLCLAQPKVRLVDGKKPKWIDWLDGKLAENRCVLYVAFGSQAKISPQQFHEIAMGLEDSKVCFLWVVGKNAMEGLVDGYEERVRERGIVLKEWVDQKEILEHEAVQGFLSHCGWSSVLEGICAQVPILAWPMLAEQWLNAKMVVEEINVGMGVNTVDGSAKGFVNRELLKDSVIELMGVEKARGLKERLKEVAEAARNAMAEGGSSWNSLDQMIEEVHELKKINRPNMLSNNDIGE